MQTLNEIREQPIKHQILSEKYPDLIHELKSFIIDKKPEEISFVGCGSSYYLAMGLSRQLKRFSRGKVASDYYSGSEVMFGMKRISSDSLLIGLSRSGESSETVEALKKAKSNGIFTAAITCEPESFLTRVADVSSKLDFINEKAIVMTKSFTSMAFLASALARDLFSNETLLNYLKMIPEFSKKILTETETLLDRLNFGSFNYFAFLGYEEYFATGMEGVIKATETSLSDVDCYQTLEYRHGPKSKVNEKSLITVIPNEKTLEEELRVMNEMRKLGGTVLAVYKEKIENFPTIVTDYKGNDFGDWFLKVIPLQMIGVKRAVERGLNPDQPTNLTKVVKF